MEAVQYLVPGLEIGKGVVVMPSKFDAVTAAENLYGKIAWKSHNLSEMLETFSGEVIQALYACVTVWADPSGHGESDFNRIGPYLDKDVQDAIETICMYALDAIVPGPPDEREFLALGQRYDVDVSAFSPARDERASNYLIGFLRMLLADFKECFVLCGGSNNEKFKTMFSRRLYELWHYLSRVHYGLLMEPDKER